MELFRNDVNHVEMKLLFHFHSVVGLEGFFANTFVFRRVFAETPGKVRDVIAVI